MQEMSLEIKGGSLFYLENRNRVTVLRFEGNTSRIAVPEKIGEKPVTEIYKKAFFNCRHLRFLTLPDTVEEIGSWAFAYCRQLEQVVLPQRRMTLGQDLFIGSDRLKEIRLRLPGGELPPLRGEQGPGKSGCAYARTGSSEGCSSCKGMEIAELLAVAATKMEDHHLFSIEEAGTEDWLKKWDARMLVILREDDSEGFAKQVPTGVEDFGNTDLALFTNTKRKAKIRLVMIRLLHPCGLPEQIRKELEEYLLAHTKGCPTEETWQVMLEEFGDEKPYYELFTRLGCVTEENFDGILQDMKDEHTEMKAWLMKYKEENLGYTDFFDSLSLDF